jgi:hypothetical protein
VDEELTGNREIFDHAAVDMYPANLDRGAAVGFAVAAGDAMTTIKIRDDRDGFPGLETRRLVKVDKVAGQLVTEDPGVGEIGLGAFEGVQVGAADADAADFYDCLAGVRQRGVGFAVREFAGLYANESLHF